MMDYIQTYKTKSMQSMSLHGTSKNSWTALMDDFHGDQAMFPR